MSVSDSRAVRSQSALEPGPSALPAPVRWVHDDHTVAREAQRCILRTLPFPQSRRSRKFALEQKEAVQMARSPLVALLVAVVVGPLALGACGGSSSKKTAST